MEKSILTNKKLLLVLACFMFALAIIFFRVLYIQTFLASDLQKRAYEQQTRDRLISPNRGAILDRNLSPLATTQTVASVSVIYNQIENRELVAKELSRILEMDFDTVYEKVNRRVALERIKARVPTEAAQIIRDLDLSGIVVDEDIQRVYPYSTLAAQVIGFVGGDNQGIIGLEAKYDEYLKGTPGRILTETDARGLLLNDGQTFRIPPINGNSLVTSLDLTVQQYAEQTISTAVRNRNALRGSIIVMNPNNGQIYAMANYPDFDLNDPFTINDETLQQGWHTFSHGQQMDYLNQMWRNFTINDTFEPGSTFKVLTATMGLEQGLVDMSSMFVCNGYHTVGGRQIRCWRFPRNHGSIDFLEGIKISCNPVFMVIAERLGAEVFYEYMQYFGFTQKTGVDLPGEASGIMHKLENIGPVELATMSFGQSFQITPLQLMSSIASVINGGYKITPHIGTRIVDHNMQLLTDLSRPQGESIVSFETSQLLRNALEQVVYDGTGNKSYIPGLRIGGKTATSEKLPRRSGNYIASFVSFAPAENPQVMSFVLVDEPQGLYYGGQVAGPIMQELLSNVLPHMGIEVLYYEEELELNIPMLVHVPSLIGLTLQQAQEALQQQGLQAIVSGEGDIVVAQFPIASEEVNKGEEVIVFVK